MKHSNIILYHYVSGFPLCATCISNTSLSNGFTALSSSFNRTTIINECRTNRVTRIKQEVHIKLTVTGEHDKIAICNARTKGTAFGACKRRFHFAPAFSIDITNPSCSYEPKHQPAHKHTKLNTLCVERTGEGDFGLCEPNGMMWNQWSSSDFRKCFDREWRTGYHC